MPQSELLGLYHSELQPRGKLYVCVRTVKKLLGMRDRNVLASENYLQGSAAAIYVLSQRPSDTAEQEVRQLQCLIYYIEEQAVSRWFYMCQFLW